MAKSKLSEKEEKVRLAVEAIQKSHGRGSILSLGDPGAVESVEVIPSGSLGLDVALGVGGYPRGRVIEAYGTESGGKTTMALHAIAQAQRLGDIAAFVDAEHSLDVEYARKLGVNVGALWLSQPDCGEQALDIVESLVRSEGVGIIVIDSVAALTPRAEIEGEMGDSHVGLQARLMSQALRKLTAICHRTRTILFFINQLRMKIGVRFGNPETTTGGNALRFYASIRLDVRRSGKAEKSGKEGDDFTGVPTRVRVVKNKVAAPFRVAEFTIRFGEGIDAEREILELALSLGIVEKSGAWFSFGGERIGQGTEAARAFIQSNPKARAEIVDSIRTLRDQAGKLAVSAAPESDDSDGETTV